MSWFDKMLKREKKEHAENRLLKFVVVVIALAAAYNQVEMTHLMKNEKIVVVPPGLNSRVEIIGDKASDEYVKSFARYVCGLALTYTPGNARLQFAELLTSFSSEKFPDAKKQLYGLADTIETAKVTNIFAINAISIDPNKHEIEVKGQNIVFYDDKKIPEQGLKSYLIGYQIQNGKFSVVSIGEKGA